MDCSLPGSSVHGISQAWILEWVAISFSRGIFSTQESNRVSFIADTFFTDWATREAKLGLKRKAVYNWFTSCWSVNSNPTNLPEMVLLCKKDILFRLSFNLFQTEDQVNIWSGSCSVVSDSLWPPMDYIVHGILRARILEWVAFPYSRGSSQPTDRIQVSRIAGGFFTSRATGTFESLWKKLSVCSPLSDLSIPWLGDSNGEMVAIPPPIHLWKAWTTLSYLSFPSKMHKVPRSRVAGSFLHPYYCDRVSSLDEVRLHVILDSRISCCLLSPSPWGENGELCSRGEEVSHFIVACVSWWATGLLCRKTLWNSLDLRERAVVILPCKVSSSEHSLAARDCVSLAIGHP